MSNRGKTVAQRNRAIRQESLRELLASQKHLEHAVELAHKIADLDEEIDAHSINRLKIAMDAKLKIVNKYLPDLKSTELTGDGGGSIQVDAVDWTNIADQADV